MDYSSPIKTTAQDVTASWADLGAELTCEDCKTAAFWFKVDINSSQNVRLRVLGKHTSGGDAYTLPIRTVSASDVKIESEYFEFNVDADQNVVIAATLDGVIPFVQLQVMAGTVGATAGQIDSVYMTRRFT